MYLTITHLSYFKIMIWNYFGKVNCFLNVGGFCNNQTGRCHISGICYTRIYFSYSKQFNMLGGNHYIIFIYLFMTLYFTYDGDFRQTLTLHDAETRKIQQLIVHFEEVNFCVQQFYLDLNHKNLRKNIQSS